MSFYRKLILITAGLLLLPSIASAKPLEPFIDLQERGLTLTSTGAGAQNIGAGSRTLTVTINGPVRFALLYWTGRQRPCDEDAPGSCATNPPPGYRDQDVIFDGVSLQGTVIGEEVQPVSGGGPIYNVGYFADVTSLVGAKGTGTHGFSFSDGNLASNLWRLNGVSLVVAYTDPANLNFYRVLVWDGLDFAFGIDPTPGDNRSTAAATFNHGANTSARTAELHLGAGDCTADRPDRIDISNNASVAGALNLSDGNMYDNEVLPISIPAGVGTTSVQLVSPADLPNPDSMLWIYAALRVRQLDATKPRCPLTLNDPGPPARIEVTFQDTGSGLAELLVTKSENADTVVPPFTVGTTDPVVVSATKIDQTQRARVEIRATDLAGNVAFCDPILALVARETGKPEEQTFTDVPRAEHVVTVVNGRPGLKNFEVVVNGRKFKFKEFVDGQQQSLDVSSAMRPGDNTVTLRGTGTKGTSASVMLWDGAAE